MTACYSKFKLNLPVEKQMLRDFGNNKDFTSSNLQGGHS